MPHSYLYFTKYPHRTYVNAHHNNVKYSNQDGCISGARTPIWRKPVTNEDSSRGCFCTESADPACPIPKSTVSVGYSMPRSPHDWLVPSLKGRRFFNVRYRADFETSLGGRVQQAEGKFETKLKLLTLFLS
jgi:hypothetical protein